MSDGTINLVDILRKYLERSTVSLRRLESEKSVCAEALAVEFVDDLIRSLVDERTQLAKAFAPLVENWLAGIGHHGCQN